jgi:CxxC motif-containing protein (DUF1111 family)
MGITTPLYPKETVASDFPVPNSGHDITDSLLRSVTRYVQTLAVPARRNLTKDAVLRGKALFTNLTCIKCHIPSHKTATNVAFREVSNQQIFPYSDLLLHDMGPGLADNRPSFRANGQEWRTPPLWGIGLTQAVNGHTFFLHDGRARSLTEAILWHGGEAQKARDRFTQLTKTQRQDLLSFLGSL